LQTVRYCFLASISTIPARTKFLSLGKLTQRFDARSSSVNHLCRQSAQPYLGEEHASRIDLFHPKTTQAHSMSLVVNRVTVGQKTFVLDLTGDSLFGIAFREKEIINMNSEKFFLYIHRFNTLIPAGGLVLLICLVGWSFISSQGHSRGKQIIPPAGASVEAEDALRVHLAHFDGGAGNLILLVNANGAKRGYEGRDNETRNLLFVSPDQEKAQWLFPDQNQILSRILPLDSENDTTRVIYLEIQKKVGSDEDSKSKKVTLSLVKSDGSKLTTLISDADEVMGHRERGNDLQVTYQKDDAIRSVRVSLNDFKIKSDRLVVSLSAVKR